MPISLKQWCLGTAKMYREYGKHIAAPHGICYYLRHDGDDLSQADKEMLLAALAELPNYYPPDEVDDPPGEGFKFPHDWDNDGRIERAEWLEKFAEGLPDYSSSSSSP